MTSVKIEKYTSGYEVTISIVIDGKLVLQCYRFGKYKDKRIGWATILHQWSRRMKLSEIEYVKIENDLIECFSKQGWTTDLPKEYKTSVFDCCLY